MWVEVNAMLTVFELVKIAVVVATTKENSGLKATILAFIYYHV